MNFRERINEETLSLRKNRHKQDLLSRRCFLLNEKSRHLICPFKLKGIPEEILASDEEHCIRIPMIENERSLNLSNSVAIVLYEALRQNDFNDLLKKGELHKLKYSN